MHRELVLMHLEGDRLIAVDDQRHVEIARGVAHDPHRDVGAIEELGTVRVRRRVSFLVFVLAEERDRVDSVGQDAAIRRLEVREDLVVQERHDVTREPLDASLLGLLTPRRDGLASRGVDVLRL